MSTLGQSSAQVSPAPSREARRCDLAAGLILLLLTLFRFWYAGHHELVQDEAYYWQWSRHLDWGYYDNTPFAAVVIRFFTTLIGSTEVGVRAGAIFSAVVASVFIYLLAKRLLGPSIALFALVLANIIPLFAAGSVLMTHDPVQMALWTAALYVIHRALTDRPNWWYGAGILAGVAAQAKLNALLLLPGIFLYLMLSRSARDRWLRRPEPYIAGLIALLIFSPFVWWNHTHQNAFWIHIHSMGTRSSGHDGIKWLGNFLSAQLALLSPFVFFTYLFVLYDGWKRGAKEGDDAILFLWCPSFIVFAATIFVSLQSKVEGNWAIAAYMTGSILMAVVLLRTWKEKGSIGRTWVGLSLGFSAYMAVVFLFPAVAYEPYSANHRPLPKLLQKGMERTNELYGWATLAQRVQAEERVMGGQPFVFGLNYRMPSEAAFYLPGQPQTYSLFLHDRANEYMFWEDPKALVGRNAVFINDTDTQDHFDDLRAVFTRVEPQPPLLITRKPPYQTPIRTLQIVRCYGFKGYDPKQWQVGW